MLTLTTVECHLSEHVGTEGCSDNRSVRIIDGLTYDTVNDQHRTHASHLLHLYSPFTFNKSSVCRLQSVLVTLDTP